MYTIQSYVQIFMENCLSPDTISFPGKNSVWDVAQLFLDLLENFRLLLLITLAYKKCSFLANKTVRPILELHV